MKRSVINANIEWAMDLCKRMISSAAFLQLDTGRVGSKKRSD